MVQQYQLQPGGSLRGPIEWFLFLGWEDEPGGTPIYKPVSFDDTGQIYTPQTPLGPQINVDLTSRTTLTVSWIPAAASIGPATIEWDVQMRSSTDEGASWSAYTDLVASPFDHDILSADLTGLPVATPEIHFQFRVRGVNADGPGDWSTEFEVFWGGTVVNPPKNPKTLTITNVTSTSARLNWVAATDAATDGATKQGIWSGNTNLNIDIDVNAITYLWGSLASGTPFANINIRRFNAGGWSGATNWVDFTTLGAPRVTVDDPVMGQSTPNGVPAYRTQLDAVRVYDFPDVLDRYDTYSPRVLAVTGGASKTATSLPGDLEDNLIEFYEGVGSAARQSCEYHWAIGNEADKDGAGYTTGTLPQAYINNYAACWDVIMQTKAGGGRRFPNATQWVDMTGNNLRTAGSGPRFKPIARYLHGFANSCYPAGRTIQAGNELIEYDPAGYPAGSLWSGNSRNAYAYYLNSAFTALRDWRLTGGPGGGSIKDQLNMFACWEFGIPIHHSLDGEAGPWVRGGAVGVATDLTQKPRYIAGGAKTSGPADQQYNFYGFLNFVQDKCEAEDVAMREMLYWNQQSNPAIPNKFQTDHNLTDPDSQDAWFGWEIGSRLPNI